MNTITDAELNRRLAEKLGYHWYWPDCKPESAGYWDNGDETLPDGFSPATDRNHLAEYVLPEIVERGLWGAWCKAIMESDIFPKDNFKELVKRDAAWLSENTDGGADLKETLAAMYAAYACWFLSPRVLALAALKALEEKK